MSDVLDGLSTGSQALFVLVLLAGSIASRHRISSTRPREGWLVAGAIGTFAILPVVLALFVWILLLMTSSGPPTEGPPTFVQTAIWWLGYVILILAKTACSGALAWIFILYATFGPGSTLATRYLSETSDPQSESTSQNASAD